MEHNNEAVSVENLQKNTSQMDHPLIMNATKRDRVADFQVRLNLERERENNERDPKTCKTVG